MFLNTINFTSKIKYLQFFHTFLEQVYKHLLVYLNNEMSISKKESTNVAGRVMQSNAIHWFLC